MASKTFLRKAILLLHDSNFLSLDRSLVAPWMERAASQKLGFVSLWIPLPWAGCLCPGKNRFRASCGCMAPLSGVGERVGLWPAGLKLSCRCTLQLA